LLISGGYSHKILENLVKWDIPVQVLVQTAALPGLRPNLKFYPCFYSLCYFVVVSEVMCSSLQKVQHEELSVYANQLLEKEHSGCHALLRDDKVFIIYSLFNHFFCSLQIN
jgi:hypothetical protein